jgi:hypothetical protein
MSDVQTVAAWVTHRAHVRPCTTLREFVVPSKTTVTSPTRRVQSTRPPVTVNRV